MERLFFVFLLAIAILYGCQDSDDPGPVISENRTVLIYMAADNSLGSYGDDKKNLSLMMQGMESMGVCNGHLVVYWDPVDGAPCLLSIELDAEGKAVQRVIENYPEENSASPQTLRRVIERTKEKFPAKSYGLFLWSHGMGWIPQNYNFRQAYAPERLNREFPRTRTFGEDKHPGTGGNQKTSMEITELAEVLPAGFSFILFDACLMGSIEVAYELREKCEYMIASPAEVLAEGFPYHKVIPLLWGEESEMKRICEEFYHYYNERNGMERSATVSLTRTSELDALAQITRSILKGRRAEIFKMETPDIFLYPGTAGVPPVVFDLKDYIRAMATEAQFKAFCTQLDKTVVYKAATEYYFDEPLPSAKVSGLSSYIPLRQWQKMDDQYFQYQWPQDVY